MAYKSGQVTVGTTATLVATPSSVPETGGLLISSSVAAFIGPSTVTTTTGLPIPATTLVNVPVTGASTEALYAVVASGTATVSYCYPG
jgi:hypothetical protein